MRAPIVVPSSAAIAALFVWDALPSSDPSMNVSPMNAYPNEDDVALDPAQYVDQHDLFGNHVIHTEPIAECTKTRVRSPHDVDVAFLADRRPLEDGDRVSY